ncbi:hypothetical protein ACIPUC_08530 [Streptomyces sp. LARHCF249]
MKPYTVHYQLYGTLAVVTLCAARDRNPRRGNPVLAAALAALPAQTDSLVLDLDHADGTAADGLIAVRDWARVHGAFLTVLGGAAAGAAAPSVRSVRPGGDGGTSARSLALRREMGERVVAQWALGIRRARRGVHPCAEN